MFYGPLKSLKNLKKIYVSSRFFAYLAASLPNRKDVAMGCPKTFKMEAAAAAAEQQAPFKSRRTAQAPAATAVAAKIDNSQKI